MDKKIYCISGLGADERVFVNLHLKGYELHHLRWLRPHTGETIAAYAARMALEIKEENPVLLGVSFGGMVAIEIARQRPVQKLILVSSIKSMHELPRWMRVSGRLRLNRFLPTRSFKFTEKIDNNRLGVSTEEERQLVSDYRRSADRVYMEWAIGQVLNWKNDWIPSDIFHIHGEKDRIFPVKKIRADHVIAGATHFMIYNRAKEIGECIDRELEKASLHL